MCLMMTKFSKKRLQAILPRDLMLRIRVLQKTIKFGIISSK